MLGAKRTQFTYTVYDFQSHKTCRINPVVSYMICQQILFLISLAFWSIGFKTVKYHIVQQVWFLPLSCIVNLLSPCSQKYDLLTYPALDCLQSSALLQFRVICRTCEHIQFLTVLQHFQQKENSAYVNMSCYWLSTKDLFIDFKGVKYSTCEQIQLLTVLQYYSKKKTVRMMTCLVFDLSTTDLFIDFRRVKYCTCKHILILLTRKHTWK